MVGDGLRADLTLEFLGEDGRDRDCEEPIGHLDFAIEVPELCYVFGFLEFEELSRGEGAVDLTDTKESSPPTCSSLPVRLTTLRCFVYFQVNNGV